MPGDGRRTTRALLTDWQTESYSLNALLPSGRFVPRRVRVLEFLAETFARLPHDVEKAIAVETS